MEALKRLKMPLLDFQRIKIVDDTLVIAYVGIDRHSEERTTIIFKEKLPTGWDKMPEAEQLSWFRFVVVRAMAHELDEYLFISGLGNDPHANTF